MPVYDVPFTMEETIQHMVDALGTRWPNPWAPGFDNSVDDCALCVSYYDFGQPFLNWVVSGVIERSGSEFHGRGDYGFGRGDDIGFLWEEDGDNYHHIEKALTGPDGNGNFLTIGTNAGPGDNMAIRTRNTRYVVGWARPRYKGAATAGGPGKLIDQGENAMYCMIRTLEGRDKTVAAFFDAGHWHEYAYDSTNNGAKRTQMVVAVLAGCTRVDENADIWHLRSDLTPTLKKPLFKEAADGTLTILEPAAGSTTVNNGFTDADRLLLKNIGSLDDAEFLALGNKVDAVMKGINELEADDVDEQAIANVVVTALRPLLSQGSTPITAAQIQTIATSLATKLKPAIPTAIQNAKAVIAEIAS